MPNSIISLSGVTTSSSPQALAISNASTVEDLVAVTPKSFQADMSPLYKKFSDYAVKASHVQQTLSAFEKHKVTNTFPPNVYGSFKVPVIQATKEYEASGHMSAFRTSVEKVLLDARTQTLDLSIQMKRGEHQILLDLISNENSTKACIDVFNTVYARLSMAFRIGVDDKGNDTFSEAFSTELKTMKKYGNDLCRKAIAIGFARHSKELVNKMARLSIKKETDAVMFDVTSNDIKSSIDEAVKRALAARFEKPAPKEKLSMYSTNSVGTPTDNSLREAHSQTHPSSL